MVEDNVEGAIQNDEIDGSIQGDNNIDDLDDDFSMSMDERRSSRARVGTADYEESSDFPSIMDDEGVYGNSIGNSDNL